jgi:hypothetical protein
LEFIRLYLSAFSKIGAERIACGINNEVSEIPPLHPKRKEKTLAS